MSAETAGTGPAHAHADDRNACRNSALTRTFHRARQGIDLRCTVPTPASSPGWSVSRFSHQHGANSAIRMERGPNGSPPASREGHCPLYDYTRAATHHSSPTMAAAGHHGSEKCAGKRACRRTELDKWRKRRSRSSLHAGSPPHAQKVTAFRRGGGWCGAQHIDQSLRRTTCVGAGQGRAPSRFRSRSHHLGDDVESAARLAIPQLSVVEALRVTASEHRIGAKALQSGGCASKLLPSFASAALKNDGDKGDPGQGLSSCARGEDLRRVGTACSTPRKLWSAEARKWSHRSYPATPFLRRPVIRLSPEWNSRRSAPRCLDSGAQADTTASAAAMAAKHRVVMVFRAARGAKAVRLRVTRWKKSTAEDQLSNAALLSSPRPLMPLIRVSDEVTIKREGAQPLLSCFRRPRSRGLAVDEIVDIGGRRT